MYVLICTEDLFNFTDEIKVQTNLMNNSTLEMDLNGGTE